MGRRRPRGPAEWASGSCVLLGGRGRSGRRPESGGGAIPATLVHRRTALRMHDDAAAATPLPSPVACPARRRDTGPRTLSPTRFTRDSMTDAPATTAGLRHSSDDRPGITRRRAGRGFTYRDADGRPDPRSRDAGTDQADRRSRRPGPTSGSAPAPNGHLQATGRDARGRKQYRYHARYRARRDTAKFERLIAFARALPAIREQVDRDLARPGLPREKVLAAVVRLLELTLIRVGNDEYARLNRSFGLTTLQDRHAVGRRLRDPVPLPGQVRQAARGRPARPAARGGRPPLPRPAGTGALPVRRRGRRATRRRVRRRQRLSRRDRARLHGEGLPDVGRDGPRLPRAAGARQGRDGSGEAAERRRGDPGGGRQPRQHRRRRPPGVRPPGGGRRLSRRTDPVARSSGRPRTTMRRPGATDPGRGAGRRGAAPGAPPRGRGPGLRPRERRRLRPVAGSSSAGSSSVAGGWCGPQGEAELEPAVRAVQRPGPAAHGFDGMADDEELQADARPAAPSSPWMAARRPGRAPRPTASTPRRRRGPRPRRRTGRRRAARSGRSPSLAARPGRTRGSGSGPPARRRSHRRGRAGRAATAGR